MSYIVPKATEFDFAKSAYNELLTTERKPVTQIKAVYGLLEDTFSTALGGSATASSSKFICQTGTGTNGIASILTDEQVTYRAGQGIGCMLTSVFDTPAANNIQIAGLITSDTLIGFGYNGLEYGIGLGKGGALEIQELQVSGGAAGAEDATVTIDSTVLTIPITAGTASHNAWEIAEYMRANYALYNVSSNNGVVTVVAKLPDFGSGTFAFSSATATAAWVEKQVGVVPTETWTAKADWNVNPDININPSKGNIYMVQFQYLGFGDTFFSIQNPETSKLEVVHIEKYTNTATDVSVQNPVFRAGWATRNNGNNTNITLQGGSAEIFIEGVTRYDSPIRGYSNSITATTSSYDNVLAFRNRLSFNSKTNRTNILPLSLVITTESTKICKVNIYEDPVFTDNPDWQFVNATDSIMETSIVNTTITSGKLLASLSCTKEAPLEVDLSRLIEILKPNKAYSVAVTLSSGANSLVDTSLIWREDF